MMMFWNLSEIAWNPIYAVEDSFKYGLFSRFTSFSSHSSKTDKTRDKIIIINKWQNEQ